MLFQILAHINANHGISVPKQRFGQRFAQFGFSHARGAEKHKRTDRALRILQARIRSANGFGNGFHGFALPHHALMQHRFQIQQPIRLRLRELRNGNARPGRNDLRDILLSNGKLLTADRFVPLLLGLLHLRAESFLLIPQPRGAFKVLLGNSLFLLLDKILQLLLQLLYVFRNGKALDALAACRLIH